MLFYAGLNYTLENFTSDSFVGVRFAVCAWIYFFFVSIYIHTENILFVQIDSILTHVEFASFTFVSSNEIGKKSIYKRD